MLRNDGIGIREKGDMKAMGRSISSWGRTLVVSGLTLWLVAGCGNIFVPKHKVTVDAISAPNIVKPAGQSFRLVGKKATLATGTVQMGAVAACVTAALAHAGMYEAPAKVPADVIIEVSCGQDIAPRADPSTRETFLELSARPNKGKALENSREPEIWNVRVSIQGLTGRVESAMPLLSAVASSYTATDTKFQTMIDVPQSNASVAVVRDTAIKIINERAAAAAAQGGAAAAAPGTQAAGTEK